MSSVNISPQVSSTLACKVIQTSLLMTYIFEPAYAQDTTAHLESQLGDLKTWLETQEPETQKAKSKFEFRVSELEKLKAGFEVEKKTWAEEKISLTQRAEKMEAALEKVITELFGLKHHVSQMVSAMFGKSPYTSRF